MKKLSIIGIMLTFVFALSSLGTKRTQTKVKPLKSSGPPACYSKEPPNNVSCTFSGCHSDNKSNSGTATVNLNLGEAENGYTPNQTYTINISISKTNMLRAGFQIIAVQDNNTSISPGTITLTNTSETQALNFYETHGGTCDATNKTWVEHTFAGTDAYGSKTWSYKWTAPSTDVGNITFYLAALEANDDQDNFGDFTYTLQKTIGKKIADGLDDFLLGNALKVFPNPIEHELTIEYNKNITIDELQFINDKGICLKTISKLLLQTQEPGAIIINTDFISAGVYFLKIKSGTGSIIKKIIITK